MQLLLKRAEDPDAYYSQTNNVVETILAKAGVKSNLETCGPTCAVMILDALGHDVRCATPGGWRPQPEDVLAAWFNDPRNYPIMTLYRSDLAPATILGNRVPQWYPPAIKAVFGVPSAFGWGFSADRVIWALQAGRGVMLTLKDPGHYIAVVGYDTDTDELIYHDPWPGNGWPSRYRGKPGRLRRLTPEELGNVKGYMIEIG